MTDELIRKLERELARDASVAPQLVQAYVRSGRMEEALHCASESEIWQAKANYLNGLGCPERDVQTLYKITDCILTARLTPHLNRQISEISQKGIRGIWNKFRKIPAQKKYTIYAQAERIPEGTFKPPFEYLARIHNGQQFFTLLQILKEETEFSVRQTETFEEKGCAFTIDKLPVKLEFTYDVMTDWLRL